ncbi:MAG: hypothetical protein ACFFD8_03895, partial [Candidatus Thorarchaeota archaeon]
MEMNGVEIEDTFAEAFDMQVARILMTAETAKWAQTCALSAAGFATSVIECKVEAGIIMNVTPRAVTVVGKQRPKLLPREDTALFFPFLNFTDTSRWIA